MSMVVRRKFDSCQDVEFSVVMFAMIAIITCGGVGLRGSPGHKREVTSSGEATKADERSYDLSQVRGPFVAASTGP